MDEIVVGTYEGFLLGYSITYDEDKNKKLKQTFATQAHTGSVRCVSAAGKFLASGGTDDKVVIVDLKTRREHTVLMNHDGTVNTVAFTNQGTHLLTGSDDGGITVTRSGNWQMEKKWKKAHSGQAVSDITVHPTDKLALSIGGDKTLRTWNLIKGRPAFTINLASKGVTLPTEVRFSPNGSRFSLISQQTVDIWTISNAGVSKRITCNSKPSCVVWMSDDSIFIGLENGNLLAFTISEDKAITYPAHKQRVKCLQFDNSLLYSVSSSGELKVWSVNEAMELKELCSYNVGCRVTCIALNKQSVPLKKEEDKVVQEEAITKESSEESDGDENEKEVEKEPLVSLKRKPGAFVAISYGEEAAEGKPQGPPKKKPKHRKKNRNKKKMNKVGLP